MKRRTKIVATMGPSTDDPKVIDELIRIGVDCVRLNFSHGSPEDHQKRANMVREKMADCRLLVEQAVEQAPAETKEIRTPDETTEEGNGDV